VTRGIQFGKAEAGELRDVGDPVELAIRYNEQGPMKWCFSISPPAPMGGRRW